MVDQSHGISTAAHMKHETVTDVFRTHVELDGKGGAIQYAPTGIGEINVWNDLLNVTDDLCPWAEWRRPKVIGNLVNACRRLWKMLNADVPTHGDLGERHESGDGEAWTLLTQQIAFKPVPASALFVSGLHVVTGCMVKALEV